MIRVDNDQRSNYLTQISERDRIPQNVYIRIGNNNIIENISSSPPLQHDNNRYVECRDREFDHQRHQNHQQTRHESNVNVEHLETIPYNPKQFNFHIQIPVHQVQENDHRNDQQHPEIQQVPCPNQNQRSTVLRHSSSVTKEEEFIDRCRRINEEVSRNLLKSLDDPIKVLKPEEINQNLPSRSIHDVNRGSQSDDHDQLSSPEKYHVLKKQLSSRKEVVQRRQNIHDTKQVNDDEESLAKFTDESINVFEQFKVDPSYHPYAITKELLDPADGSYNPTDLTLRCQVIIFLWILLGERRLLRTGYPSASIHLVLWRVVHICCSVAGVKSAAAVPLPDNHNCGEDMLCFRDHVHRFLEVCAPTRDLWKQFGWASLTVDAVMAKIYKQDLEHVLVQRAVAVPVPIRMAMQKLATLEKEETQLREEKIRLFLRNHSKIVRVAKQGTQSPRTSATMNFRPILPKPPEKKKRGRPIKIKKILPDTGKDNIAYYITIKNKNSGCVDQFN